MNEIFKWMCFTMWVLVTVLPFLGWKLEGDMIASSVSYAGLTIALAILLNNQSKN